VSGGPLERLIYLYIFPKCMFAYNIIYYIHTVEYLRGGGGSLKYKKYKIIKKWLDPLKKKLEIRHCIHISCKLVPILNKYFAEKTGVYILSKMGVSKQDTTVSILGYISIFNVEFYMHVFI